MTQDGGSFGSSAVRGVLAQQRCRVRFDGGPVAAEMVASTADLVLVDAVLSFTATVQPAVAAAHRRFDAAPIRDFVPVFVERIDPDALSEQPPGAGSARHLAS